MVKLLSQLSINSACHWTFFWTNIVAKFASSFYLLLHE